MKHRLLSTALLAALLAGTASAQTTPAPAMGAAPAPAVSPAKKELVAQVIALQQPAIDAIAQTIAQQSITRLLLAANQALQTRVPPDKRDAVAKSIDTEARKYLADIVPLLRDHAGKLAPSALGPILEEKFNEDELRQLVAWLGSSVNKKYQQVAPELQTSLGQKIISDTRGTVEPKLKSLEQRVAGLLNVPPPKGAPTPAASAPSTKH